GALLLDRTRDRGGDLRDAPDGRADLLDRRNRFLRRGLDVGDLLADLIGRLRGLLGERLHLGGDHGKALACRAGPRGLDGRVERQQVGLPGDRLDQIDDVADAACGLRQFAYARVGLLRLADGLARDLGRSLDLPADLADRRSQLFARGGDGVNVGRGL